MRIATCNARKELSPRKARRVVRKMTSKAEVVAWQEITPDHMAALKELDGWRTYHPGTPWGLAISWRTDLYDVRRKGKRRVAARGIKGVDPARGCIDIVLTDRRTAEVIPVMSAHLTHQAFTSHRERKPRWDLGATRLAIRSRTLTLRWGCMTGTGDMNRDRWAPKGTTGHWAGHGTYGSAFYDVIWTRGALSVTAGPTRVRTPSDHRALVATIRRTP